jgi:hypothetical protein
LHELSCVICLTPPGPSKHIDHEQLCGCRRCCAATSV